MTKYSLGLDMAKKDFYAALCTIDTQQRVKIIRTGKFQNTTVGFQFLEKWLNKSCSQKHVPLRITLEATGVYYESCALYLQQKGYYVSVVLPNKAKKYAAALGVKTKTDKTDAKSLSRMGAEQALTQWTPMSSFFYQLRALTRHHHSLSDMRTALLNQMEGAKTGMYHSEAVIESLTQVLLSVEEQIKTSAKAITAQLQSDAGVAAKVKHLTQIKGVGELSVAVVLAETGGFALFENIPQLVSYAGLDVVENESGGHVGKTKISKKGNSNIRRALFMPSLSVIRWKVRPFVQLYERTLARHNIKMKSYVAVQKKLLALLYSLWKKNEAFDENYGCVKTTSDVEAVPSSRLSVVDAV